MFEGKAEVAAENVNFSLLKDIFSENIETTTIETHAETFQRTFNSVFYPPVLLTLLTQHKMKRKSKHRVMRKKENQIESSDAISRQVAAKLFRVFMKISFHRKAFLVCGTKMKHRFEQKTSKKRLKRRFYLWCHANVCRRESRSV